MLLVTGGAYSGKCRVVKERVHQTTWISAYDDAHWQGWQDKWQAETTLVLEGWEQWLLEELQAGKKAADIRQHCKSLFHSLFQEEEIRQDEVILIMLETGRGIVPLSSEDRMWRDLNGWIMQDATEQAHEVVYVWHGLCQVLK